jgi:uncharacterized membrane protein
VSAISPSEPLNAKNPEKLAFRWVYVALPVAFLVISVALAAGFYSQLPAELAYRFSDGAADAWLSRGSLLLWTLIPQAFFTLLAYGIVRVVLASTRYWPSQNAPMPGILTVMGNTLALPQIILAFAMLDIFLYNAFDIELIPLWLFAVIILVLASAVLVVFFVRAIRRLRRQRANLNREGINDRQTG